MTEKLQKHKEILKNRSKKPIVFLLCLFVVGLGFGQNLVGNPSFESYSPCPDDENQVEYATGWINFLATPDYFNSCSSNPIFTTPNSQKGYQVPYEGQAYCGFGTYWSPNSIEEINTRENIAQQLSQPLVVGVEYFISIKVALALGVNGGCASNNIGVKFTNQDYSNYAVDSLSSPLINNSAHIYTNEIITDTLNWTTISGSFIADSAYQFLVVGNFFKDQNTDTLLISNLPDPFPCHAYYYVDNVCVSSNPFDCGVSGIYENKVNELGVFPNPFAEETTILLPENTSVSIIELFDFSGKKVENEQFIVKQENKESIKIKNKTLNKGCYVLKINTSDDRFFTNKLIIH